MSYQELIDLTCEEHLARVTLHVEDLHASKEINLRMAARKGYLPVVEFLLRNGANIHAKSDQAVRSAAANGHIKVVELLIEHGADIHTIYNRRGSAINLAAKNNQVEVVRLLLERGVRIFVKNRGVLTDIAAKCYLELLQLLLKYQPDLDLQFEDNLMLRVAVKQGHLEMARFLLRWAAGYFSCPDQQQEKSTLEKWAAGDFSCSDQQQEKSTLEKWAAGDFSCPDQQQEKSTLEQRINVQAKDNEALRHAAKIRDVEMMKLLLSFGAKTEDISSPLLTSQYLRTPGVRRGGKNLKKKSKFLTKSLRGIFGLVQILTFRFYYRPGSAAFHRAVDY